MASITDFRCRLGRQFESYTRGIRYRIFGANNERLDFIMDSFFKLAPAHRSAVVAGLMGLVSLLVLVAFAVYVSRVKALRDDLNEMFTARAQLAELRADEEVERARFEKIISMISKKAGNLQIKPFFEKLSLDNKVALKEIKDRNATDVEDTLFSQKVQEFYVDLRMSKISIPRLLTFLSEIEKSNRYLRVHDLKITGIYGNKLYFDVEVAARCYKLKAAP